MKSGRPVSESGALPAFPRRKGGLKLPFPYKGSLVCIALQTPSPRGPTAFLLFVGEIKMINSGKGEISWRRSVNPSFWLNGGKSPMWPAFESRGGGVSHGGC